MKKSLLILSMMTSLSLEAATIKSIKGSKVSLKLTPKELEKVENDSSYDIMSNGSNVGRIKVIKIFPGKGIQGMLETRTDAIKTAGKVTLAQVEVTESVTSETDVNADREETGLATNPDVAPSSAGVHFNLLLGTHEFTSHDDSDSTYASNFSLRGFYKFGAIPLGIGGHLKNNMITRKSESIFGTVEAELSFNSLGLSVVAMHDFGSFRPYAVYELSSGKASLKITTIDSEEGEQIFQADSESYLANTLMIGGVYVLDKFSFGLEYQAFGEIAYPFTDGETGQTTTQKLKSTGFSVNLGYRI